MINGLRFEKKFSKDVIIFLNKLKFKIKSFN
jgi:hypothetical protein